MASALELGSPVSQIAAVGRNVLIATFDAVILYELGADLQLKRLQSFAADIALTASASLVGGKLALAYGTFGGAVMLSLDRQEPVPLQQSLDQPVVSLDFGEDVLTGRTSLAVATDSQVQFFQFRDVHFAPSQTLPVKDVTRVRFGPTGRVLGVALASGAVQILDAAPQ